MFLVDKEKISVNKNSKKAIIKKIAEAIEYLENTVGFPVIFRYKKELYTVNQDGKMEGPKGKNLTRSARTFTDDGMSYVIQCERFKLDENEEVVCMPKHKIRFDGTMILDKSQKELAAFMYLFKAETPLNHIKTNMVYSDIIMEDPLGSSKLANELRRLETKVNTYIYDFEAKGLKKYQFEALAQSYGIITSGVAEDIIQEQLYNAVMNVENKKVSCEKFLEAAKMGEVVNIKANVHKAEEFNIIKSHGGEGQTWNYVKNDTLKGDMLIKYRHEETKYQELAEFLLSQKEAYTNILNLLGDRAITAAESGAGRDD